MFSEPPKDLIHVADIIVNDFSVSQSSNAAVTVTSPGAIAVRSPGCSVSFEIGAMDVSELLQVTYPVMSRVSLLSNVPVALS